MHSVLVCTSSLTWKARPKHVSAVNFVTVVTYSPGIFQFVCVARFVAGLVDPNEAARFSPCQKILLTGNKKLLTVSKSCLFLRSYNGNLVCPYVLLNISNFLLTVSNFFLTIIHMMIAPAYYALLCVTMTQNGHDFHLQEGPAPAHIRGLIRGH